MQLFTKAALSAMAITSLSAAPALAHFNAATSTNTNAAIETTGRDTAVSGDASFDADASASIRPARAMRRLRNWFRHTDARVETQENVEAEARVVRPIRRLWFPNISAGFNA